MCSKNTEELAEIYFGTIVWNCCNSAIHNYYPLLDRIIDFMDTTYGTGGANVVWSFTSELAAVET